MSELYPLIVRETSPGSGTGDVARLAAADLAAHFSAVAAWMPQHTVLARAASGPSAIALTPGTVLGRTVGGPLAALGKADLEGILDLAAQLALRAPISHTHDFRTGIVGIDWGSLANNTIFAYIGGQFRWIAIPTGGGGGLTNPLVVPLDIADQSIVSGADELIRFQGGKLYLREREVFPAAITDPEAGHVAVFNPTTGLFENRRLTGGEITVAVGGVTATDVGGAIGELATAVGGKAPIGHTHGTGDLRGTAEGKYWVTGPGPDFAVEERDPPSGGGGALDEDLELGGNSIVEEGEPVLGVDGNGNPVLGVHAFRKETTDAAEGQVFAYLPSAGAFVRSLLEAAHVIYDRQGTPLTVQDAINAVFQVLGTKAEAVHGHNVSDLTGATPGKFLSIASNLEVVEVDPPTAGGDLAADLNLAGFKILDGAKEVLSVVGDKVHLGGLEVLPSQITDPAEGEVPAYNKNTGRFENKAVTDLVGDLALLTTDGTNVFLPEGIPTEDPGVANALWNDGGVLMVSEGNI